MRGSLAATFVLIAAGLAAMAILWSTSRVTQMSKRVENFEHLRARVAELDADIARLEGENTRLREEQRVLKDLATNRADIRDLTQEIRTMVWMAYGPHEESRERRPPGQREQAGS